MAYKRLMGQHNKHENIAMARFWSKQFTSKLGTVP